MGLNENGKCLKRRKNFDSAAAIGQFGRPAEKNFFRLCIDRMAVKVQNGG